MEDFNTVDFRERIALCKDFTADERDMILQALALGHYSDKHEYPPAPGYGRRSVNQAVRAAWDILDRLPPDAMLVTHRFMLAGMIAGALNEKRR